MQSRDENAGTTQAKTVERVTIRRVSETVQVTLAPAATQAGKDKAGQDSATAETIVTTREHPFYVDGQGFVPAGRLHVGNSVVTRAGPSLVVQRVTFAHPTGGTLVYNLTVADTHTFFVGGDNFLVHNGGDCVPDPLAGSEIAHKAPRFVSPGIYKLTGHHINDLGHVQPWHAYYDEFGRMIGRTDYTRGNITVGIPPIHHHVIEFGAEFPFGREDPTHFSGPFVPPVRRFPVR